VIVRASFRDDLAALEHAELVELLAYLVERGARVRGGARGGYQVIRTTQAGRIEVLGCEGLTLVDALRNAVRRNCS